MNIILLTGIRGHGSIGLFLTFFLIWALSYFYESWKQNDKMVQKGGTEKMDIKYWKPKIILLIAGLVGLLLPVIRNLIEQNKIGIIGSGGFEKSFEVYSSQVGRNLILFFLFPFLISAAIMVIKKEFPTRIFNNLVMIMVVLVLFVFILNTFHNR